MVAAVRWARGVGAARVVAAAPVGSAQGAALLRHEADRVVCPYAFTYFGAVGSWYGDFSPVGDDEVRRLLDREAGTPLGDDPR
jgi:predicted phosphoribosyltransferase